MTQAQVEIRHIPVTVDKSHLVTIGEKLYTEKTSFIRELVNNAYDADAAEVRVTLAPDAVTIEDDGSGMDEGGLRQYFTIGSAFKKESAVSPRFGRRRIGEFGIGKFAALAACRQFEVETQNGDFRARLLFDKDDWASHGDWQLAIHIAPPDLSRGNGTRITLREPDVTLFPGSVRRYLAERTPIHAPGFAVFLNGERVTDDGVTGRKVPIDLSTPFGPVTGHLAILPPHLRRPQPGIAVLVRGVLIRYETFRMEMSRKTGWARLGGRVSADFLPITSNRDEFIRDSPEFILFYETMRKETNKALASIHKEYDRKFDLQASRVLKGALTGIGRAIRNHRGLFPRAEVPVGSHASSGAGVNGKRHPAQKEGYAVSPAKFIDPKHTNEKAADPENPKPETQGPGRPSGRGRASKKALGSKSLVRSLRVLDLDIAVRLEHLGREESESLISGGIIYVNADHPLYRAYQDKDDLLTLHVTRVITKELTLQTGIKNPEEAFALQSTLIADACASR